MPKLRNISGKEAIRIFEKLGFIQVRQRGSHVIMRKFQKEGDVGCAIPLHSELKIGTLKGILKQAKVTEKEFLNTL